MGISQFLQCRNVLLQGLKWVAIWKSWQTAHIPARKSIAKVLFLAFGTAFDTMWSHLVLNHSLKIHIPISFSNCSEIFVLYNPYFSGAVFLATHRLCLADTPPGRSTVPDWPSRHSRVNHPPTISKKMCYNLPHFYPKPPACPTRACLTCPGTTSWHLSTKLTFPTSLDRSVTPQDLQHVCPRWHQARKWGIAPCLTARSRCHHNIVLRYRGFLDYRL